MKKEKKKQTMRLKSLAIFFAITTLIITVATYAWFINMNAVSMTTFDIGIASTDGLLLSLDGKKWDITISISADTLDAKSYPNHTNSWGGDGLIPFSSVGEIDKSISRMIFYGKSSITATPGGYRLMASRIDNTKEKEADGYVVFDLFIKNFSGKSYFPELNALNEEPTYLTVDSEVLASGTPGTGIENSVRVAFAQIGRIIGSTTDPDKITGITCNTNEDGVPSIRNGVTGICKTAQIWEPNDTKHVDGVVKWYNYLCLKRTGKDVHNKVSYGGRCNPISDGNSYPTYAVSQKILSSDNVNVYDGPAYNGYTESTKLFDFPYYTDTMKFEGEIERKEIFTLAPNSITKVRVYIYIEGQDIDNYSFASIGKGILVNFGFTKERFDEDDEDYYGPRVDEVKPVISLNGNETVTILKGSTYIDEGATALDNMDGDLTNRIQVNNPVNSDEIGTYYVTYLVSDNAGNYSNQMTRMVIVTGE